ncbi:Rrf2 family transcriptional regulator, repressor of oqxAB [Burkholderia sp. WP9]|uniref:RrF2 family transcriptional regulator n=1 Tax=Burkholderia sp. WP9 TaxID=1500263 RepID=UPI000897DE1F|nr:Rrf2 family transcriptional regulator [Burkholderia sp. WP9]SEE93190.1 Rrf2 family transcriptional regulator, repressor of oqxAB [Burkholderia sp. WP9]
MIDVRFPTALQMMLSLAFAHAEGVERLSSAQLAEGVDSNPTFVRRLLVPLMRAGLVRSTMGRDGGVSLNADAAVITLGEIYKATMEGKKLWIARSDIPHRCLVSCNVEQFFGNLADEVDESVTHLLSKRTLADALLEMRTLDAERA